MSTSLEPYLKRLGKGNERLTARSFDKNTSGTNQHGQRIETAPYHVCSPSHSHKKAILT